MEHLVDILMLAMQDVPKLRRSVIRAASRLVNKGTHLKSNISRMTKRMPDGSKPKDVKEGCLHSLLSRRLHSVQVHIVTTIFRARFGSFC